MKRLGAYLWNILIGVDQLANTVLGGVPDETISSRCGKARKHCRLCRVLCLLLNVIDKDHCKDSIEADEGRPS